MRPRTSDPRSAPSRRLATAFTLASILFGSSLRASDELPVTVEIAIRENACIACHRAEGPLAERFAAIPAPNLHRSGPTHEPAALRRFLLDPHADRPGTTMPDVFAGRTPEERALMVEDVLHHLATRGGLFERTPTPANPREAELGGELFSSVGCRACHEDDPAWRARLAASTNLAHLEEFLADPGRWIPAGHMPSLSLDETERRRLALYLLSDQSLDDDGRPRVEEVRGLRERYYEGKFPDCGPSLEGLQPERERVAARVGLPAGHRDDFFAVAFDGEISIPVSGRWTFALTSDDGSRLWVDGEEVIDHDGLHGATTKRGSVDLEEGWHSIRVTMYEYSGDEALELRWAAPGTSEVPVPSTAFRTRSTLYQPPGERLAIDRERRARGKRLYLSLGCAACHDRGVPADGAPILTALPAAPTGCLDPDPTPGAPYFALDDAVRAGIVRWLADLDAFAAPVDDARAIELTLERLECLACHARDGRGGPTAETQAHFTGTADLGDEGRLPPDLTAVGAKLRREWLHRVLSEGASVRPYMDTRMPVYPEDAVAGLADRFHRVDVATDSASDGASDGASPALTEERLDAGRLLTGTDGFRCIDCHGFAGHPSLGEPAVDLATTGERLRPEWTIEYLLDPQSKRPGTRMPSFWAPGLDLFPDVLDGTADAQVEAMTAYLSLGASAPLPTGLVVDRSSYDLVPIEEPILLGTFFEGLSPRVVCCGYPERLSLAYDVEHARLALVWRGEFMNAQGTWAGRAGQLETPGGSDPVELPPGDAIAALPATDAPWPAESGRAAGWRHRAIIRDAEGRPTFRRTNGAIAVEERIEPRFAAEGASFVRHVVVSDERTSPDGVLVLRVATAGRIVAEGDTFRTGTGRRIRVRGASAELVDRGGTQELRATVPAGGGAIEVEVSW